MKKNKSTLLKNVVRYAATLTEKASLNTFLIIYFPCVRKRTVCAHKPCYCCVTFLTLRNLDRTKATTQNPNSLLSPRSCKDTRAFLSRKHPLLLKWVFLHSQCNCYPLRSGIFYRNPTEPPRCKHSHDWHRVCYIYLATQYQALLKERIGTWNTDYQDLSFWFSISSRS